MREILLCIMSDSDRVELPIPPPRRKKINKITKADIGVPYNFTHCSHLSSDDVNRAVKPMVEVSPKKQSIDLPIAPELHQRPSSSNSQNVQYEVVTREAIQGIRPDIGGKTLAESNRIQPIKITPRDETPIMTSSSPIGLDAPFPRAINTQPLENVKHYENHPTTHSYENTSADREQINMDKRLAPARPPPPSKKTRAPPPPPKEEKPKLKFEEEIVEKPIARIPSKSQKPPLVREEDIIVDTPVIFRQQSSSSSIASDASHDDPPPIISTPEKIERNNVSSVVMERPNMLEMRLGLDDFIPLQAGKSSKYRTPTMLTPSPKGQSSIDEDDENDDDAVPQFPAPIVSQLTTPITPSAQLQSISPISAERVLGELDMFLETEKSQEPSLNDTIRKKNIDIPLIIDEKNNRPLRVTLSDAENTPKRRIAPQPPKELVDVISQLRQRQANREEKRKENQLEAIGKVEKIKNAEEKWDIKKDDVDDNNSEEEEDEDEEDDEEKITEEITKVDCEVVNNNNTTLSTQNESFDSSSSKLNVKEKAKEEIIIAAPIRPPQPIIPKKEEAKKTAAPPPPAPVDIHWTPKTVKFSEDTKKEKEKDSLSFVKAPILQMMGRRRSFDLNGTPSIHQSHSNYPPEEISTAPVQSHPKPYFPILPPSSTTSVESPSVISPVPIPKPRTKVPTVESEESPVVATPRRKSIDDTYHTRLSVVAEQRDSLVSESNDYTDNWSGDMSRPLSLLQKVEDEVLRF